MWIIVISNNTDFTDTTIYPKRFLTFKGAHKFGLAHYTEWAPKYWKIIRGKV